MTATDESGLEQARTKISEVDSGIAGHTIPLYAHIAYFWETDKEFAGAVRFLETGLRGIDHCVVFGYDEANQAVCKILQERGFDLPRLFTDRRLTVLGGNESAEAILESIAAAFKEAVVGGAPLIRLLGNIGWGKTNWPRDHDLLAFEAKVTAAATQFPCVVVCMYDMLSSSGHILQHGGFEAHPYIMVSAGSARDNPYYVPVDLFLQRTEMIAGEVADRQRRKEAIRKSEERFRTLFEFAPIGISIHDAQGQFVQVNRSFQEMLGYTEDELRHMTFADITFSEDAVECSRLFAELVNGKSGEFRRELRYVRKDGRLMWAGFRCASVGDANGMFAYAFAMVADISERIRSEGALRKSEERRRLLLEINNAIITKLTRDELFHAICEALGRVIPLDRVALSLHDPQADVLRIVTYAGPYHRSDYSPVGRVLDLRDSPAGWAFLHQKHLLRSDLEAERQSSSEERAYGHGFRSLCALPLVVRGKSIGAITVGSLTRRQYTEEDAEFLTEVADQIAIAIDNMQSYDSLRRLSGELGALVEVNRAVGRYLERDALFGALASCLQGLLQTDRFGIELPLGDGKLQGHLLTLRGNLPHLTEPHVLSAAGTACDWALRNRQWIVAASREELRARFPATFEVMAREGMESLCAIPLLIGENCRGVLFCMAAAEGAYEDLPQALLEKVAGAVAVALDNCLAHEEVRRLRDRLAAENVYLQEEIKTEYNFEEIVGRSAPLRKVLRAVEQVAVTDATVLISGETGTGKELFARAIHNLSARKERPLVKVNCGAIPAGLVESELFGHEKGAFTGATQRRSGRFELAHGGTIFLDEVAELPLETQVKLLRVLQEGEFERVGSSQTLKVDVRVIAATNRDLRESAKHGSFRSDLYYRLSVFPLEVPALRERQSDIPLLVNFFLSKFAKKLGKEIEGVAQKAMEALIQYSWPGNIRELQNVIERGVVLAQGPLVQIDESVMPLNADAQSARLDTLEKVERAHILRALEEARWVIHGKKGAAFILGMNPSTLRSRMEKLGIKRGERTP